MAFTLHFLMRHPQIDHAVYYFTIYFPTNVYAITIKAINNPITLSDRNFVKTVTQPESFHSKYGSYMGFMHFLLSLKQN